MTFDRVRLAAITLGVALVAGAAPAGLAVTPADPCQLTLRDPGRMLDRQVSPAQLARTFVDQVVGDRDVPSDHPAMRALDPAAYQVILELP